MNATDVLGREWSDDKKNGNPMYLDPSFAGIYPTRSELTGSHQLVTPNTKNGNQ